MEVQQSESVFNNGRSIVKAKRTLYLHRLALLGLAALLILNFVWMYTIQTANDFQPLTYIISVGFTLFILGCITRVWRVRVTFTLPTYRQRIQEEDLLGFLWFVDTRKHGYQEFDSIELVATVSGKFTIIDFLTPKERRRIPLKNFLDAHVVETHYADAGMTYGLVGDSLGTEHRPIVLAGNTEVLEELRAWCADLQREFA